MLTGSGKVKPDVERLARRGLQYRELELKVIILSQQASVQQYSTVQYSTAVQGQVRVNILSLQASASPVQDSPGQNILGVLDDTSHWIQTVLRVMSMSTS